MRKPKINTNPPANRYTLDGETVIEISHPTLRDSAGMAVGTLVSIRATEGRLILDIYRADPPIVVCAPDANWHRQPEPA